MPAKDQGKTAFLRSLPGYLLKFLIAGGIIYFICAKWQGKIIGAFEGFRPLWLIPAAVLYGLHIPAFSWRWMRLARILQIRLSCYEALSLSMQGLFFSLVIPGGAFGGDVVKAAVLSRRTPAGSRAEGAFTVLMDRIVGMIALFILSICLVPFSMEYFRNLPFPGMKGEEQGIWIAVLVVLISLAGLGASCAVFFHRTLRKVGLFEKIFQWGNRITGGMAERLTNAVDVYSGSAGELTFLTVFGIFFVHLMTAWPTWFLLMGFGVKSSLFLVVVAVTIGNIAGVIPFFPSGVGGRDLVIIAILVAGGIPEGIALSAQLIYTGILLAWTLAGGIFFIFDRGRKEITDCKTME